MISVEVGRGGERRRAIRIIPLRASFWEFIFEVHYPVRIRELRFLEVAAGEQHLVRRDKNGLLRDWQMDLESPLGSWK